MRRRVACLTGLFVCLLCTRQLICSVQNDLGRIVVLSRGSPVSTKFLHTKDVEWHHTVRTFAARIAEEHPVTSFFPSHPFCVAQSEVEPNLKNMFYRGSSSYFFENMMPPSVQFTRIVGTLKPGVRHYSPDGRSFVEMQTDSRLVVNAHKAAGVSWISGPYPGNVTCLMKEGGALAIVETNAEKNQERKVLWSSGTAGYSKAQLAMQNDGNLSIYGGGGELLWRTRFIPSRDQYTEVPTGQLHKNVDFVSPNRFSTLRFTKDGDLVFFRRNGHRVWTKFVQGHSCHMLEDGDLTIYDGKKKVKWSSGTRGNHGARLLVQNDGDMGIYTENGSVKLWSSNTAFDTLDASTFLCNRELEDYEAALQFSQTSRRHSTRPILGNGLGLVDVLRNHLKPKLKSDWRLKEGLRVFDKFFRPFEAWDILAFRETWTDIDTEELRHLDGGAGIFVDGPLTTASFAARLPSIRDFKHILEGRHVAIVGNGKSLLGRGKEIDLHPVVVRFNYLVGDALKSNDTGLKTNIHTVVASIDKIAGPDVVVFDLEGHFTWKTYCKRLSLSNQLHKTFVIRPSAKCAMHRISDWTRGFVFFWLVGSMFEKFDFYGMSAKDGGGHYRKKGNVIELFVDFEHALYSAAQNLTVA